MRGDTAACSLQLVVSKFQSTLPVRGDTYSLCFFISIPISIHSPHAGRYSLRTPSSRSNWNFNPLSLCREIHLRGIVPVRHTDFNPPSPCGEMHKVLLQGVEHTDFNPLSPCGEIPRSRSELFGEIISIHPPRVGRDEGWTYRRTLHIYFNPPSPCGEMHRRILQPERQIQISIHSPYVGRYVPEMAKRCGYSISIHFPQAGRYG